MKQAAVIILFVAISFVLADPVREPSPVTAEAAHVIRSHLNEYAVSLLHQLSDEKGHVNVAAAPFSILSALASLIQVSGGQTQHQLAEAFYCHLTQTVTTQQLLQMFSQIYDEEILLKDQITPPATYVLISEQELGKGSQVLEYPQLEYNTEVSVVDFAKYGDSIVEGANEWVAAKSGLKLGSILDSPPPADTSILLLNIMPFTGAWRYPLKAMTKKQSFFTYASPQGRPQADFMTLSGHKLAYKKVKIAGRDVQALELPFEKDNMGMVILLPTDTDGLEDILGLDFEMDLKDVFDAMNKTTADTFVNVKLPKFQLKRNYAFNFLQGPNLNVTDIFSKQADLKGLAGDRKLHVTQLLHETVISVDEYGSITTARDPAKPESDEPATIEFWANHPFIFYIRDRATGVILFIGKIEEPEFV